MGLIQPSSWTVAATPRRNTILALQRQHASHIAKRRKVALACGVYFFLKDAPREVCAQTIEVRALGCPTTHCTGAPRSSALVSAVTQRRILAFIVSIGGLQAEDVGVVSRPCAPLAATLAASGKAHNGMGHSSTYQLQTSQI